MRVAAPLGSPELNACASRLWLVMAIVSSYGRESGVRQLERQIGAVARKVARKIAAGDAIDHLITPEGVRPVRLAARASGACPRGERSRRGDGDVLHAGGWRHYVRLRAGEKRLV